VSDIGSTLPPRGPIIALHVSDLVLCSLFLSRITFVVKRIRFTRVNGSLRIPSKARGPMAFAYLLICLCPWARLHGKQTDLLVVVHDADITLISLLRILLSLYKRSLTKKDLRVSYWIGKCGTSNSYTLNILPMGEGWYFTDPWSYCCPSSCILL
jgi:hypothetical protein